MRYLLDANVLSALVRSPRGAVAERIRHVGDANVCTSIVVAAELRYGAARKGSERPSRQVETVSGTLHIAPVQVPHDRTYADLRIAAQALTDGSVLVTDNTREFARVTGLTIENWLRP